MKLQVERDPLAEAVAWTARALPARPTAPVLAGMRLQAGSELTLSTFDYEVSAQSTIPVQADEPGTVLVSGRLLAEIVRSLPARPVDLTTDGTRTTVKCGSATFTLMLLPTEEYPTLPGMPETTGTIGADTFASAISQVAIAAGRDDTLPALTGIRMEINEDTLTLVATDRYRLAVRELPHVKRTEAGQDDRAAAGGADDEAALTAHEVLEAAPLGVDVDRLRPADTGAAHAPRDHGGVRRLAAPAGEHPGCGDHAFQVVGGGLPAYQDDLFPLLRHGHRVLGVEHRLADRSTGRGVHALGDLTGQNEIGLLVTIFPNQFGAAGLDRRL